MRPESCCRACCRWGRREESRRAEVREGIEGATDTSAVSVLEAHHKDHVSHLRPQPRAGAARDGAPDVREQPSTHRSCKRFAAPNTGLPKPKTERKSPEGPFARC